jgi:hypothetical protein
MTTLDSRCFHEEYSKFSLLFREIVTRLYNFAALKLISKNQSKHCVFNEFILLSVLRASVEDDGKKEKKNAKSLFECIIIIISKEFIFIFVIYC